MNKTVWGDGFHLNTESLNFLQDSFLKGFEQIVGNDYSTNYIVSGVEKQADGSITAGVVVIGGEIMPFVASAVATDYMSTTQEIGTNKYKNEQNYPAYYSRYAYCVESGDNAIEIASLPRMVNVLKPQTTSWSTDFGNDKSVSEIGTDFANTSCCDKPFESYAQWRVDECGNLLINGTIKKIGSWSDNKAIAKFVKIPSKVKFTAYCYVNDTPHIARSLFVSINTDGEMYIDQTDLHVPASISAITYLVFPMQTIKLY